MIMKIVRTIMSITLCIAILATIGVCFYNNYTQNHSGRYTSVTTITEEEREWILERFGREYESIEEYISFVQDYAREHFHYNKNKKQFFQHFDFDDIVEGDEITNSLCFDFSVLFKHITIVLDEKNLLPAENIKVYVTDISYKNILKPHHSYNIISLPDEGKSYYVDITVTVSRAAKGLEPKEAYEIFTCSIEEYCKRYNEKLLNLH